MACPALYYCIKSIPLSSYEKAQEFVNSNKIEEPTGYAGQEQIPFFSVQGEKSGAIRNYNTPRTLRNRLKKPLVNNSKNAKIALSRVLNKNDYFDFTSKKAVVESASIVQ